LRNEAAIASWPGAPSIVQIAEGPLGNIGLSPWGSSSFQGFSFLSGGLTGCEVDEGGCRRPRLQEHIRLLRLSALTRPDAGRIESPKNSQEFGARDCSPLEPLGGGKHHPLTRLRMMDWPYRTSRATRMKAYEFEARLNDVAERLTGRIGRVSHGRLRRWNARCGNGMDRIHCVRSVACTSLSIHPPQSGRGRRPVHLMWPPIVFPHRNRCVSGAGRRRSHSRCSLQRRARFPFTSTNAHKASQPAGERLRAGRSAAARGPLAIAVRVSSEARPACTDGPG